MWRKLALMSAILCCLLTASVNTTEAAYRDVPRSMLSLRDRLLSQRDRLYDQRAELDYRIKQAAGLQKRFDEMLYNSCAAGARYDELQYSRTRVAQALNDLLRRLDYVEKALINNNKDLSDVEYHIAKMSR